MDQSGTSNQTELKATDVLTPAMLERMAKAHHAAWHEHYKKEGIDIPGWEFMTEDMRAACSACMLDALKSVGLVELLNRAQHLTEKLDTIDDDPSFKSIWPFLANHGFRYSGPDYRYEVDMLKYYISKMEHHESAQEEGE